MGIPEVASPPPFNVTRSSHVRLYVKNLAASVHFYIEVLGFVVSDQDHDVVYLRGIEEACHHSLVLMATAGEPSCECIGMRVGSKEDLDKAHVYLESLGCEARFIERAYQGPTLLASFGHGCPPFELCFGMPVLPRLLNNFVAQKGGRALRLDHYQCVVPDVHALATRFMAIGFRPSKYTVDVATEKLVSVFLHRKNNPHDLVLAQGAGPRLHHFCYIVQDLQTMLRAADVAANLGFGRDVEHGPGRHGPPNGVFIYFRDPDGHRIEFGLPPMQYMDPEEIPNAWDSTQGVSLIPWGAGPPQQWREEASNFAGIPVGAGPAARWMPQI